MSDANPSQIPVTGTGANRNNAGTGNPPVAGHTDMSGTGAGVVPYVDHQSNCVPGMEQDRYGGGVPIGGLRHSGGMPKLHGGLTAAPRGLVRRGSLVSFHGTGDQPYTGTHTNPQQPYFAGIRPTGTGANNTVEQYSTGGGVLGHHQLKVDAGAGSGQEMDVLRYLLSKHGLSSTGSAMEAELRSKQFQRDDVLSDDVVRQRLDAQLGGLDNPLADYDTYRALYSSLSSWTHNTLAEHRRELFEVLFVVFVEMWLRLFKKVPSKAALFLNEFATDHMNTKRVEVCALKTVLHPRQLAECAPPTYVDGRVVVIALRVFAYKLLMTHIISAKSSVILDIIISRISFRIVPLGSPSEAEVDIVGASCPAKLHFESYMINSEQVLWGLPEESYTQEELTEVGNDNFEKPTKADCGQLAARYDGEPTVPIDPAKLAPTVPEPQSWTASFWRTRNLKHYMNRDVVSDAHLPSVLAFDWDAQLDITAVSVSRSSAATCACAIGDASIRLFNVPAAEHTRAQRYTAKRTRAAKNAPANNLGHSATDSTELHGYELDVNAAQKDDDTAGFDGDLPAPDPEAVLLGHEANVYAMEFSANDRIMLSGGVDHSIRLWSVNEASCLATYSVHGSTTWDIAFAPYDHYFASGGSDATARLWALDRSYPLRLFADFLSCVNVVKFHPNGSYLATGSADGRVGLVDVRAARTCRLFFGTSSSVLGLAVSHNGRLIASGSADGSIIIWDIAAGKQVDVIREHKGAVRSLDFSHGSQLLASGGTDMSVKLWDIANAACALVDCRSAATVGGPSGFGRGSALGLPQGPPHMQGESASQMAAGMLYGEDALDRRPQTYNATVFGSDRLSCSLPLRDRTVASLAFTPRNLLVVCSVGKI